MLKQRDERGFDCPSGSTRACFASLRSNPWFGTLGRQLALNGRQVFVPAVGTLDYKWVDNKGVAHDASSPFQVKVGLGQIRSLNECGEGAAPAPRRVDAVQLRLDASNYALPLPFRPRTVEAGKVARVTQPIAAAKSSDHAFRVIATLANGEEVTSLPVHLLYFRPRPLPTQ